MSRPFQKFRTLIFATASSVTPFCGAQTDDVDLLEIAPLVVTATRRPQTVDETLTAISVIDRAEIDRLQITSVEEALRRIPGISISNNGGRGKATSVFIRGTQSDHVLVLIDGLRVGSATTGTTAFQDLPIDQIDRIEVVRGPRSSLYGSEAIGGVIQIFTRRGESQFTPYGRLGYGTDQTFEGAVGVRGRVENGHLNVGISGIKTDGFNACNGVPNLGGCFTTEPDRDGYEQLAFSANGGYRISPALEIGGNFLRSKSESEFDGSFVNESDSIQQIIGLNGRLTVNDFWQINGLIGHSTDDAENFKDSVFRTRFRTRKWNFSLQNDFAISSTQNVIVGLDYVRDAVSGTTAYERDSRGNKGIFGQYQGQFGAFKLQASARHDDNGQFGGNNTGGLALGYEITPSINLFGSFATAFKAPAFNQLYFPGFSNPNLSPEKSRSFEIGVNGRAMWGLWSANAYYTLVDDLIAFDAAVGLPNNINEARIYGVELSASGQQLGIDWQVDAALLDTENRATGANRGNRLPRRASETLQISLDKSLNRFNFGLTAFAAGKRFDDLANSQRLGGYTTVDLRGSYQITRQLLLEARITNLFDKSYETAAFYNQAGRAVFAQLRYQP